MRRLRRSRERRATGLTTVEGPFLLEEAIAAGAEIHEVFVAPGDATSAGISEAAGVPVTIVAEPVLEALSGSVTPRGPVAVVSVPQTAALQPVDTVVLWDMSDPGNAGTIIRTAGAFGFQVASTAGSVDLWSPKVVRAGVGGHFRASLVTGLPSDPSVLHSAGLRPLIATAAAEQSAARVLGKSGAVALIIGNEAHGVPDAISNAPNVGMMSLPMPGGAESLNAAVAAGILMYLRMTTK